MSDDSALSMSRRLASEEGILCGISAGANVAAAVEYANVPGNENKLIVTVIPDFGERYIQTVLFEPFRYDDSDDVGVDVRCRD